MSRKLSSQYYAIFFVPYAAILCLANYCLFGEFIPTGSTGLWILASFAPMMGAELLVRTIASSPSDSAANSLVAIATVLSLSGTEQLSTTNASLLNAFLVLLALIFSLSLLSIWLEKIRRKAGLRKSFAVIASNLGNPKVIFTLIHFYVLYTLHLRSELVFWMALIWIAIVFGRPFERLVDVFQQLYEINRGFRLNPRVIGDIVSRSHPSLLTIKVEKDVFPEINSIVVISTSKSHSQAGVVLDNYRLSDELWSKALLIKDKIANKQIPEIKGPKNVALSCSDDVTKRLLGDDFHTLQKSVVGSVIEKSDISRIRIEMYRDNFSLSEGQMLSVKIGEQDVLYQVINGITESEELQKSNRHGYMQVNARKLGFWNSVDEVLEQVPWTPDIFTPVSMIPMIEKGEKGFFHEYIGFLPGTRFGVKVKCSDLVTHNTAILGVLGSGKTTLALELILRMVSKEIKVLIIDITGEYEKTLYDLGDHAKKKRAEEIINGEIQSKSEYVDPDQGSGGNHKTFAGSIGRYIDDFINDRERFVRILNPNNFHVTEQTSFERYGKAGIAELTPAQITRIVSEQILNRLREDVPEKTQLCLVLEEAHSLVPEGNSVADRRDQNASNGTARAVMQGRKHGFGCLLITQRTANVTKSILNQCNTMFALQIFDNTGKEFLQNYFGEEYASMLPSLQSRHCVAYGRGLNAKTPVLIELNDSEEARKHLGVPEEPTATTYT